jgi:hypothetical protein
VKVTLASSEDASTSFDDSERARRAKISMGTNGIAYA